VVGFEPCALGEAVRAGLVLTSPTAGVYEVPLTGQCVPPKPYGPGRPQQGGTDNCPGGCMLSCCWPGCSVSHTMPAAGFCSSAPILAACTCVFAYTATCEHHYAAAYDCSFLSLRYVLFVGRHAAVLCESRGQ